MRGLGQGRLEAGVPEGPVCTIQHPILLHSLLKTADGDAPTDGLEVGLRNGNVFRFPRRGLERQVAENPLVGNRRPLVENRAAHLQLLDIGTLLSISLAKVVLGVTVHGDVFPGAQKDGNLMGFHFPVAEGDNVE